MAPKAFLRGGEVYELVPVEMNNSDWLILVVNEQTFIQSSYFEETSPF